jgi:EpsG family
VAARFRTEQVPERRGLPVSIYYTIFLVLLCAVIAGFQAKRSLLNKSWYVLGALLLIACAGLRAESVGADYDVYREYFTASPDALGAGFFGQWISTMPAVDVGYVYLNSLIKTAGLPYEALVFLLALTAVASYALFFWKHTRFSAIALMLYYSHDFFHHEMIAIRSGGAAILILWGFHFWASQRKRTAVALMVLAVLTHLEAAVVILPILISCLKIKTTPKYVFATLLGAIIVGYILDSSYSLFALIDRLATYQGSDQAATLGIFTNPVAIKQLMILGTLCWLMNSRKNKLSTPIFQLCVTSYWMATLWMISFNQFGILSARGYSLLGVGEGFIVAQMVAMVYEDQQLRRYRRLVSTAVVCYALTTLIVDLQVKNLVDEYRTTFSYDSFSFRQSGGCAAVRCIHRMPVLTT